LPAGFALGIDIDLRRERQFASSNIFHVIAVSLLKTNEKRWPSIIAGDVENASSRRPRASAEEIILQVPAT